MEVKILDPQGNVVVERNYPSEEKNTQSNFSINEKEPGVYIVNVIIDGMVKVRKIRLK